MTKGGRIAGGILAIINGGFILVIVIFALIFVLQYILTIPLDQLINLVNLFILLIPSVLALVGGILLCTDKTAGGILALIGGGGALFVLLTFFYIPSFITNDPNSWKFFFDTIAMIFLSGVWGLSIVGGIVGIAVGSES